MNATSSPGGDLPNSCIFYDVKDLSITVSALATGGIYVITNSTKTYSVNSNIAASFFGTADMMQGINGLIWGKQSGNSTDTYSIVVQSSVDDGVTWVDEFTVTNLGGANNGKVFSSGLTATHSAGPFTNNHFKLRLVIKDVTDPTTNAFTLNNIRCTYQFFLAK